MDILTFIILLLPPHTRLPPPLKTFGSGQKNNVEKMQSYSVFETKNTLEKSNKLDDVWVKKCINRKKEEECGWVKKIQKIQKYKHTYSLGQKRLT